MATKSLRLGTRGSVINSDIAADVYAGLSLRPRSLPPKLFYDAAGSELFDRITELDAYYLTRTERELLAAHAGEMIAAAGQPLEVVELGAGSASKTGLLLAAILRRQLLCRYVPIDISADALHGAEARLRAQFERVAVEPVVADYTAGMPPLARNGHRRLALYLGSSIGNFDPAAAAGILRDLRKQLRKGDALLLGADRQKPEPVLLAAYDDAQGVTAAFNKNVLARINRELGGDFDLEQFRHLALWNARASRIEMHLESARRQVVTIRDLAMRLDFEPGERIHTENSYKYAHGQVETMLREAGFTPERMWSDERQWFAVYLARA